MYEEYLRKKLAGVPRRARRAIKAGKSLRVIIPLGARFTQLAKIYARSDQYLAIQQYIEQTTLHILQDTCGGYDFKIRAHQPDYFSPGKHRRKWVLNIHL